MKFRNSRYAWCAAADQVVVDALLDDAVVLIAESKEGLPKEDLRDHIIREKYPRNGRARRRAERLWAHVDKELDDDRRIRQVSRISPPKRSRV